MVFWEEFPPFNEAVSSMISFTLNCQTTYFIDENVEIVIIIIIIIILIIIIIIINLYSTFYMIFKIAYNIKAKTLVKINKI